MSSGGWAVRTRRMGFPCATGTCPRAWPRTTGNASCSWWRTWTTRGVWRASSRTRASTSHSRT
eukprot:3016657-Lingulodinium_polyedra.AAC.1